MTVKDWLETELKRCREDVSRIYDRAPHIAATYIGHYLLRLDQRFPRHGWGWQSPTIWHSGLCVIPAIWGEHDADKVAIAAMRKLGHRRQPFQGIRAITLNLATAAKRIQRECGDRGVTEVLSPRASAWGLSLGQLSPERLTNRHVESYRYGPAIHCAHKATDSASSSVADDERTTCR